MSRQENSHWPDLPFPASEVVNQHGEYMRATIVRRGGGQVEINAGGKHQEGDEILGVGANMEEARMQAEVPKIAKPGE